MTAIFLQLHGPHPQGSLVPCPPSVQRSSRKDSLQWEPFISIRTASHRTTTSQSVALKRPTYTGTRRYQFVSNSHHTVFPLQPSLPNLPIVLPLPPTLKANTRTDTGTGCMQISYGLAHKATTSRTSPAAVWPRLPRNVRQDGLWKHLRRG